MSTQAELSGGVGGGAAVVGRGVGGGKAGGGARSGLESATHHNLDIQRDALKYLLGFVLVLATALASLLVPDAGELVKIPALVGALVLAFPLFRASFGEILRGRPSTSTLASLAILGALAIDRFVEAGILAFILLIADQFVRQSAWGAKQAIEQLVRLTPDVARVIREDGLEESVSLRTVRVGDVVRVRPGENLPVDGEVVNGTSSINQASLTGEAVPHEVEPGALVYAGTTNLSSVIDLRVTQVGEDTTIGKVTQLIREAEASKTPRQMLVEQVATFFVPVALGVAGLVWFMTGDMERAITVLVIACPSALLLSSPLAMVAAFTSAARLGVMIKQTNYLEAAAGVDTVVMDKTGTMTTGQFAVSKLVPADGVDGATLLQAAANAEQHSNHPLARSILATATRARIKPDGSDDYEEIHGRGVRARTSMGELHVGRAKWLVELFPHLAGQISGVESRIEGMSGVHVAQDGRYLGVVALEDRVRPETRAVVQRLRDLGVRSVAIFTGDRLSVAGVLAAVGADRVEAECLPEEKHEQIQALVKRGRRVLMVGDGINDGPSLAAADVGVAMGLSGSDIATNSAGVALMTDDLTRVSFLIELARRTRLIVAQNIAASILIALIGLALAATGQLTTLLSAAGLTKEGAVTGAILFAGLYHVAADLFVIFNSFRLVRFGESQVLGEEGDEGEAVRGRGSPAIA